jgi:hypothetical protein
MTFQELGQSLRDLLRKHPRLTDLEALQRSLTSLFSW